MKETKVQEITEVNKEVKNEKKSFIKNLKINRKTFRKIGATLLLVTGIGAGIFCYKETKKIPTQKENFENTLNRNNENTFLDEIITYDGMITNKIKSINSNLEVEKNDLNETTINIDLLLCIKNLETYITLSNKINNLNYKNKEQLTEVDKATKEELFNNKNYIEYVENLINKFNNKNTSDIEKARTYQKLDYLNQYYKKYVTENGFIITEDLLKKSLKALACETSGLEIEYYNKCKISDNKIFLRDYITVNDPVSGVEYKYKIGPSSKIVNTVLNDLYKIQRYLENKDGKIITYELVASHCSNTLDNTKELLETKINTKNYEFTPEKAKKTKVISK